MAGSWTALPPDRVLIRQALILLVYALAFYFAHRIAALWGGRYFYSLLFPPSGVRLALLWWKGAAWTPAIALTELAVQIVTGVVPLQGHGVVDAVIGIIRPVLLYGLAVAVVRAVERRSVPDLSEPPMPFALASVGAPVIAALGALAYDFLRPGGARVPLGESPVVVGAAFLLGDLLGVLLIAPPLLWLVKREPVGLTGRAGQWLESLAVFLVAWWLALTIARAGGTLYLTPVLLAAAWIGLRCGRAAAWLAIMVSAAIALPLSAAESDMTRRMALHMELAALAVAGYLAGSFSDAQRRARRDIARRDRLLFQAARLKSLRAMSLSVIHEVSQPLSTLAIEARHLADLTGEARWQQDEIASAAVLIDRKVAALAEMVRRLRRFGGREVDDPRTLSAAGLLREAASLVRNEFRLPDDAIAMDGMPDQLTLFGREVELVQALVNVLRNAIQASAAGAVVRVAAGEAGGLIWIEVRNRLTASPKDYSGMGIGSFIAREIIDAHGGTLFLDRRDPLSICCRIELKRSDHDQ